MGPQNGQGRSCRTCPHPSSNIVLLTREMFLLQQRVGGRLCLPRRRTLHGSKQLSLPRACPCEEHDSRTVRARDVVAREFNAGGRVLEVDTATVGAAYKLACSRS